MKVYDGSGIFSKSFKMNYLPLIPSLGDIHSPQTQDTNALMSSYMKFWIRLYGSYYIYCIILKRLEPVLKFCGSLSTLNLEIGVSGFLTVIGSHEMKYSF